jgi:DNA uptake protein ComE-like DNA-binding protein
MFLVWGGGIAHALLIRKAYVRRLELLEDPALQRARLAEERRAYARELARNDPELAREALIGRSGGFDEAGVVDVNHAAVEDLADLPGIDAATARRIVAVRDGVGGFSSLEDLGMTMDLPGDVVERLRGHVVCLPR